MTHSNRKEGLKMKWSNGYRIRLALVGFVAVFAIGSEGRANTGITNQAPIADAGSSRYAAQDPVVLDGTGSYDPDNSGPLSYTWYQISGPTVVITDADTGAPTISGFVQTDEVQECEFELVVSDGGLTSLPDIVEVIIVPDFGADTLRLENPPFDRNKPTRIYFGGGDCVTGGVGVYGLWSTTAWTEEANVISFNTYGPDPSVGGLRTYYRYGDMIIVYLSSVAPDYRQPIQTSGWSTGGQLAIDAGIHLNQIYADARYAVNHVTLLDAAHACREVYPESIATYLASSVEGEQCWIDNYISTPLGSQPEIKYPGFHNSVLNVDFDKSTDSSIGFWAKHDIAPDWYKTSLSGSDINQYNSGVVAGAYWSVIGPGKNLQLASTPGAQTYRFKWYGWSSSGYMDFDDVTNHPGMLPEPVMLIEPVNVGDPNGFVLTCQESENAVGYELLLGNDPYRVMDYDIISDTPAPPNDVITALPSDGTWWTVRVRDHYGSTIYADPISMVACNPNPADGAIRTDVWANPSWTEGMRAASYDVYFGESFVDVQDGAAEMFRGNQTTVYFFVGFAGFPYPDGLVSGTTYFWWIDDVGSDGTVIHKGKIWRFAVSL